MIKPRDFSSQKSYPGTNGNPFDVVLHRFELIQKIPAWMFTLILFGMAYVFSKFNWFHAAILSGFILLDWIILAMLPKFTKSFGPPKPPVLILSILRGLFFLILPFWYFILPQIIGTALVIWGFWIEPHRIKVTEQLIETSKIPANKTIKLLHLGDLHIERITQREKQIEEIIERHRPDVICFSGDILNLSYLDDDLSKDHAKQVIRKWKAPHGVYVVTGSPAVDHPEVFSSLVNETDVRWLNNETEVVQNDTMAMRIIGITCSHNPQLDLQTLLSLQTQNNPATFTILLYHSPDLAPHINTGDIDLQLSGHTHGGQVRLPWFGALVTGSLYGRKLQQGRYQFDNMVLYVTRGIGMEGAAAPRVRFLCPPEIILWTIRGKSQG